MPEITCKKCGSTNISYQREQTGNIGGSFHTVGKKRKGIIYWLLIGWWVKALSQVIKITMAMCTMGVSLLFTRKKKEKLSGKTISAHKTINKTMAVCQGCGHTWKA